MSEMRRGPFKIMSLLKTVDPRAWVPDPEKTKRILNNTSDVEDRKGEKRG